MANNGADAIGQVGTNWAHAAGTDEAEIRRFSDRLTETYQTPFVMGRPDARRRRPGAEREQGRPELRVLPGRTGRDGLVRFLRSADLDVVFVGNFVDLGFYETQGRSRGLLVDLPRGLRRRVSRSHRGAGPPKPT